MFHVCESGKRQSSFLCPKGTIFNQKHRVCDWWYNVKCEDATEFYDLNLDLLLLENQKTQKMNVPPPIDPLALMNLDNSGILGGLGGDAATGLLDSPLASQKLTSLIDELMLGGGADRRGDEGLSGLDSLDPAPEKLQPSPLSDLGLDATSGLSNEIQDLAGLDFLSSSLEKLTQDLLRADQPSPAKTRTRPSFSPSQNNNKDLKNLGLGDLMLFAPDSSSSKGVSKGPVNNPQSNFSPTKPKRRRRKKNNSSGGSSLTLCSLMNICDSQTSPSSNNDDPIRPETFMNVPFAAAASSVKQFMVEAPKSFEVMRTGEKTASEIADLVRATRSKTRYKPQKYHQIEDMDMAGSELSHSMESDDSPEKEVTRSSDDKFEVSADNIDSDRTSWKPMFVASTKSTTNDWMPKSGPT